MVQVWGVPANAGINNFLEEDCILFGANNIYHTKATIAYKLKNPNKKLAKFLLGKTDYSNIVFLKEVKPIKYERKQIHRLANINETFVNFASRIISVNESRKIFEILNEETIASSDIEVQSGRLGVTDGRLDEFGAPGETAGSSVIEKPVDESDQPERTVRPSVVEGPIDESNPPERTVISSVVEEPVDESDSPEETSVLNGDTIPSDKNIPLIGVGSGADAQSDSIATVDKLGRFTLIEGLSRFYRGYTLNSAEPFFLGVFGGWGRGKSSFVEMLIQSIKEEETLADEVVHVISKIDTSLMDKKDAVW